MYGLHHLKRKNSPKQLPDEICNDSEDLDCISYNIPEWDEDGDGLWDDLHSYQDNGREAQGSRSKLPPDINSKEYVDALAARVDRKIENRFCDLVGSMDF